MHLVKPETLEFIFVKGKLMSKALNVFFSTTVGLMLFYNLMGIFKSFDPQRLL